MQQQTAGIRALEHVRDGVGVLWGIVAGLAFCVWTMAQGVVLVGAIVLYAASALLAPVRAYLGAALRLAAAGLRQPEGPHVEVALAGLAPVPNFPAQPGRETN